MMIDQALLVLEFQLIMIQLFAMHHPKRAQFQ